MTPLDLFFWIVAVIGGVAVGLAVLFLVGLGCALLLGWLMGKW